MIKIIKILIFSHLFFTVGVVADLYNKSIINNNIKWDKFRTNENVKNKILWESYDENKIYLEDLSDEIPKKIYTDQTNKYTRATEFIPLNIFPEQGDISISTEWKSSFYGGQSGGGTGQQNNSLKIDYGLSKNTQLTFYFAEADDDLYNLIQGKSSKYFWQNYAFSIKKSLFNKSKSSTKLSFFSSIEYWRRGSGSNETINIFGDLSEKSNISNSNFLTSFSFPFSKSIGNKVSYFFVPGISFLPDTLNNKKSYGNNLFISNGLEMNFAKNLKIFASYTNLLGPGNNSFDRNLSYSRVPIYSYGMNWDLNSKIGLEGRITNSFGSTPATGILTIPSDNKPLYSLNFTYRPYQDDIKLNNLNSKDQLINFGGLSVNNALIPKSGISHIRFNTDSSGNLLAYYAYSLSNLFQLELVNIGHVKSVNDSINKNLNYHYLDKNNLNFRLGGKLLLFSPQKDDLIWTSLRTTFGRNHTDQGYAFSELINTLRVNQRMALNISPKYFYSGVESFGALGISSYLNITDKIQIIPEMNFALKNNSDNNSTLALRYKYHPSKSVDIYYSNALGFQDLGQIIKAKDKKFGIKFNYLL